MKCEDARQNLNAAVDGELGRAARVTLGAHLLRCAACRGELAAVRVLSRQLAAMPAPFAGAVTRPAHRGPSPRAWKLAAAAAVVAMLLPLAGSVVWKKVDAARWRHEMAQFRNPAAATPAGRGIYTVHYVAKSMARVEGGEWEGPDSAVSTGDVRFKYPDKARGEYTMREFPDQPKTSTCEGDRTLTSGGFRLEEGSESCEYRLGRTVLPLTSPDAFTETGVRETGFVQAEWDPTRMWDFETGENVLQQREETGPPGTLVIVTEHWKTGLPGFHGVYRTFIDRATHLVTGWDYQVTGLPHDRAKDDKDPDRVIYEGQRSTVDHVEYNEEMPDELFSTEPPRGATVLDCYSPEGIAREYDAMVRQMEQSYQTSDPETWAKAAVYWSHEQPSRFPHLDLLPAQDQAEIRARLHAIGIDLEQ
jgi:hypothetical protein